MRDFVSGVGWQYTVTDQPWVYQYVRILRVVDGERTAVLVDRAPKP